MDTLLELGWQFAVVSMLAFGGANAVLPEMHRIVVENHHWMNDATFAQLFAIAQAAPGPNFLVITLIGWQVAGLAGAICSTVAFCLPSSLLIYALARVWERLRHSRWRYAIEIGVSPLAVGLVLSSGWLIALAADADWRAALLTALTVGAVLRWKINPLWWILAGALAGLAGLV